MHVPIVCVADLEKWPGNFNREFRLGSPLWEATDALEQNGAPPVEQKLLQFIIFLCSNYKAMV